MTARPPRLTDEQLDAIAAREKAATPGPWTLCPYRDYFFAADGHMVADHELGPIRSRGHGAEVSGQRPEGSQDNNADFIAHSRADIPALLAEVRAGRELRRKAERASQTFALCDLRQNLAEARQQCASEAGAPPDTIVLCVILEALLADEEVDHGRHEAMSTHTTDFDGSVPLTLAPDRPLPPSPTNERDTLEQPKAVELRTIPSLISREEVLRVLREMAEASPSPWWPAALTTAIARIEALK